MEVSKEELFFDGAILIIEGLSDCDIQFDFNIGKTLENFKGIKMITPGFHALRVGGCMLIKSFHKREVFSLKWSKKDERLELIQSNLPIFEIEPFLMFFEFSESWIKLTNYIQGIEYLILDELSEIQLTKINFKECFPKGSTPEQITQYSMDNSWYFKQLFPQENLFLSELQLSLILLSCGNRYEGLSHWTDLVRLGCHSFCLEEQFYTKFASVLSFQLEQFPELVQEELIEWVCLLNEEVQLDSKIIKSIIFK